MVLIWWGVLERQAESSGESSSEHLGYSALRLFLARKGTCTEANIITPYLQPFYADLYSVSLAVFRQKGMDENWLCSPRSKGNCNHTHTSLPSVLPRPRGLCSWCKTLLMSALLTLSCKDYCILTQALQPRNIPESKQKWLPRRISSCSSVNDIWGAVTAKCSLDPDHIAPLWLFSMNTCEYFKTDSRANYKNRAFRC